ncbi:MAG: serine/threonine protein kinase [Patescibacteria group bacterium]|nr:serine/threonine protein kinase [Patescibacteria group bacterium]
MPPKSKDEIELKDVKFFLRDQLIKDKANLGHEESISGEALEQPVVGYKLLDKLGSGGMSVVFKAEMMKTGKIVALKLLYPHHGKKALKQFLREGMILMCLDHPHILKGYDFGVSKGFYFLAMEFVEGESLYNFIKKGFLFSEFYTFQILLQIAQALEYLDARKIVHRDIKPDNILMIADEVKLCDFGLALDTSKQGQNESLDEFTCGTVEYISPEQARGNQNLDGRSDVYSLGITGLQMITGQLPYHGSPQEIMRQQIYEPIVWEKFSKISLTGQEIFKKMLAKQIEKRLTPSQLVVLLKESLPTVSIFILFLETSSSNLFLAKSPAQ